MQQLNVWHLKKINTPTTAIDNRRNYYLSPKRYRARRIIRNFAYSILSAFPPYIFFLRNRQKRLIKSDTNFHEYASLIESINPDIIFCLTPYFIEEELLLRAAEANNIPISTAILSFDNLTTRGYLSVKFEEYYLWNKYNVEELKRIYPESRNKEVKIVGPPQFDFYYDRSYLWTEERWRGSLNLPPNRPVILFGSASKIIAPQEEQWLIHLDEAISKGEIIQNPLVLLRRHPNEGIERWLILMDQLKNVILDEPWKSGKDKLGKTNITRFDIEKLVSTLYHCQVHINASSTMTVDGAIFDRPQIGPAYDEVGKTGRLAKEIYLREHYLPITQSGGLDIVFNRQELIQAVNNAFSDPARFSIGRKKIVEEICTYSDGLSTERVTNALREFVKRYQTYKSKQI